MRNPKLQIPNPKKKPNPKSPNPNCEKPPISKVQELPVGAWPLSLIACLENRSSRGNEAPISAKRPGFQDNLSLVTAAATRKMGFFRHALRARRHCFREDFFENISANAGCNTFCSP